MSDYDHSIARFKDAKRRLAEAQGRIDDLVVAVREGLAVLEQPHRSCVSDRSGVMGEQRIVQAAHLLEASRWPRIQDIDAALKEFQQSTTGLRGAYQALSIDDRETVAPHGIE